MKMFLYYITHSFKNQIKKLFKTWVVGFILICGLIGGVIGFTAATLTDTYDETHIEEVTEQETEEEISFAIPIDVSADELFSIITAASILGIFLFETYNADTSGSKIFLPADVNLLFPSPRKPQSILLFRLMNKITGFIFVVIYLWLFSPSWLSILGIEISMKQRTWLLVMVFMALVFAKLLQILLYTYESTHTDKRKPVQYTVYGCLIAIVVLFELLGVNHSPLQTAVQIVQSPFFRYFPIIGWIYSAGFAFLNGMYLSGILFVIILVVSGILLVRFIWNMDADFYEDALAKSQETAALQQQLQESEGLGFVKRKKQRKQDVIKNQFHYGTGASVFFYRTLYNRYRFARFHFMTKTLITYTITTLLIYLASTFVFHSNPFEMVMLTLGLFVFYRTLNDSLSEDTSKVFFRMIPQSTWKKLFYSLLGGLANCFLDLLIPVAGITILTMTNPLITIGYLLFILSVYFFSTTISTFLSLSLPESLDKTIRQFILVMLVYFGLIPDALCLGIGIALNQMALGVLATILVNLGLGALFLSLTPIFLDPKETPVFTPNQYGKPELRAIKKVFSKTGFCILVIMLVTSAAQIIAVALFGDNMSETVSKWLLPFIPMYCIGVPAGLLVLKKVPVQKIQEQKVSVLQYVRYICISIFMMYSGNLIGTMIINLLHTGNEPVGNGVENLLMSNDTGFKILFVVILGPMIEELIFRKFLLDRLHVYGTKTAIFVTALLFALFHTNISQFFYAFTLGLFFAYVYLSTGKIRYSIGLHMLINFLGSVVSVWLLERIDLSALQTYGALLQSGATGLILFVLFEIVTSLVGLVLLILGLRKVIWKQEVYEIPRGSIFKTVFLNPGMGLVTVILSVMTIATLFS